MKNREFIISLNSFSIYNSDFFFNLYLSYLFAKSAKLDELFISFRIDIKIGNF